MFGQNEFARKVEHLKKIFLEKSVALSIKYYVI